MKNNKLQRDYYNKFIGADWPSYDDYVSDVEIKNKKIKKEIDELEKKS